MCYNLTGDTPMNLDNNIVALPTVQVPREVTTSNGCHVSLRFRAEDDPKVHREIAGMLLAAFERKRSNEHETSIMPVQSFYKRAG